MEHKFEKMINFLMNDKRVEYENPDTFLPRFIKSSDVVADIGCGPGFYCIRLAKLASQVYCVDKNEMMLIYARKNCASKNVEFLSDVNSLPKSGIDIVLMANSFHDMENRNEIYKALLRALKNGGKILIIDWKKDKKIEKGPPYNIRMSEQDYVNSFPDFNLKEKFEVGPYHYGMLFVMK
ncbi:class I SAM-dependent methyltransferase [Sulfuracidifex metallicus]|uniref:class I SAM-dependent methyltransferase n=1 Tax=Sulfuracidifex metallicus TaxID=47303 RepID=UPI0022740C51|nr:class I SAM-dependent methyltransferase [Sulfuracidifex metallicus]MCY0849431.1 class I SAM-dependent methyltransferase [Sulfuracidifex metallicus]